MNVVKRVFRLMFDFERAEEWLNVMASRGWMMESFICGLFTFSKGTPGDYYYRMELLPHYAGSAANKPYLSFAEETGVELVCVWVKWAVYRKKASEGTFDIYTDASSRLAHYRRAFRFLLFFCLVEWGLALWAGCSLIYALLADRSFMGYPSGLYTFIVLFGGIIGVLIFRGARKAHQKYRRLKHAEPFLE